MRVKLGEVFESQIAGEWGSECAENENGTKVLRTTNFTQEGRINYDDVVIRSINQSKVEKKRLHYGDIILEKSGGTEKTPVGRVVFCDEAIEDSVYLCNNFTQAMRVNQSIASPKYVFYYMWNFHCSGKTELLQNKTTGIRNLQVRLYLDLSIPLPPLETQRHIAAVLDKVSALIAKRRQQLDKLDELVKARFVEMFGDMVSNVNQFSVSQLGIVCDVRDGTHDTPQYCERGYPLVTSKNVTGGKIDLSSCGFISEEDFLAINKRSKVDEGDIIMPMIGTIGKPVIVSFEPHFAIKNVALIKFPPEAHVKNIYIKTLLESDYFDRMVLAKIHGGTQKFISLGDIRNLKIAIPPIDLQNQFAAFVTQTEKTKAAVQQALEKLETMKKALMQEYFG